MHDEDTPKDTPRLPPGYTLDLVGDPCVIILRRPDGSIVARFGRYVEAAEITSHFKNLRDLLCWRS